MSQETIIIAGAGPVGMTTALALTQRGIPVRIFEATKDFAGDPRASSIHPASLDMLEKLGLTDEMLRLGYKVFTWQFWDRVEGPIVTLNLPQLEGHTRHPFRLQLEQHVLCGIIAEKLAGYGVKVEFNKRVHYVSQDDGAVQVEIEGEGGERESLRASYLIATDGGRSSIRKALNISFEGYTLSELFVVATTAHNFRANGFEDACHFADPDEWATLFRVPNGDKEPLWRISMPVLPGVSPEDAPKFDTCSDRLQVLVWPDERVEVIHTNLYGVHQRVAGTFREGRVLLAGDAAHVNGPTGALGMNFGIQDAMFLAEQMDLALATSDFAPLDRYDRQRRTLAQAILQTQPRRIKARLELRDPQERRRRNAEMRKLGDDPAASLAFLKEQAMLNSVAESLAVA